MIVGCVTNTIKDLNQIPEEKGISSTASPSTLITGRGRAYCTQVTKINFGNYVHAYINKGKMNTNMTCTVGAIALHPS